MAGSEQNLEGGNSGFFVPMVDMLAGVIFILIIMLVSVALLARDDYTKVETAQKEITAITKELEAARAAEATYLVPRRQASEALRALIARVSRDLSDHGVSSAVMTGPDRLRLDATAFLVGGASLSDAGKRAADILSDALARSLVCLTDQRASAACADIPDARLARVVIAVHSPAEVGAALDAQSLTDVQAVNLFAELGRTNPSLVSLRNPAGQKMLGYAALGDSVLATEPNASEPRLEVVFEMFVPPLPDQQ